MYKMCFKLYSSLAKNIASNLTSAYQRNIRRSKSSLISSQSYKEFENILGKLLSNVSIDNFVHANVVDRVIKITECIAYEEKFRGPLTIHAYECFEKPVNISKSSLNQLRTLAWGTEMVHSYASIFADLDKSHDTSYWCNYDPSLLRSFVYELLREEFHDQPLGSEILKIFDKAFLYTTIGLHLDMISRKNYKNFTPERYNLIINHKTTFHTFQLPVLLAAKLTKDESEHSYKQLENVCKDLGKLYSMQTDYLDCYGEEVDESGIPQHSWDIQCGKCSWLAVSALERCTSAQRIVFTTCYGSKEPAHIERVKLLYDQMQMPKLYFEEKEKLCEEIVRNVNRTGLNMYLKVLDVIKNQDHVEKFE